MPDVYKRQVLVALTLASCQETPKGYVINGEVTGRTDGKVYLKSFRNKMFFDIDTAELKEGKFTFKGEGRKVIKEPQNPGIRLLFFGKRHHIIKIQIHRFTICV